MDPLTLVRQATMNKASIKYADGYYIFGKYKYHETTKTSFRRTHQSGGHYSLRDVIFFLENADVALSEYRSKAAALNITAVVIADKQNLKNYLCGIIATCDQIDKSMVSEVPLGADDKKSKRGEKDIAIDFQLYVNKKKKFAVQVEEFVSELQPKPVLSDVDYIQSQERKKRRFLEESHDQELIDADRIILGSLRVDEFAASTRNMVLCKSGADFSFALKLFNDHILKEADSKKQDSNGKEISKAPDGVALNAPKQAYRGGKIIIIVPSAITSTISSINALPFLEKGQYLSRDELGDMKRKPEQFFRRNGVEYMVIDSAAKLRDQDWERVGAVFAQGQAWQFKDWKWSNPTELFHHVLGVHLAMDDREVESNILSWNCRVLKINRTRRHLDAGASSEFWNMLHDYLSLHKPWLLLAHASSQNKK